MLVGLGYWASLGLCSKKGFDIFRLEFIMLYKLDLDINCGATYITFHWTKIQPVWHNHLQLIFMIKTCDDICLCGMVMGG
jgi:hypothetical protein